MVRIIVAIGLTALGALAGCDLPKQRFACVPGLNIRERPDTTTPSMTDAQGNHHC